MAKQNISTTSHKISNARKYYTVFVDYFSHHTKRAVFHLLISQQSRSLFNKEGFNNEQTHKSLKIWNCIKETVNIFNLARDNRITENNRYGITGTEARNLNR